jgi:hypothetical protein
LPLPLFSVPVLRLRIAPRTVFEAVFEYFRAIRFLLGAETGRRPNHARRRGTRTRA